MLLAVAVLMTVPAMSQVVTMKIGYVDSETILKQLPEAIKAQGDLDALIEKWNGAVDSMSVALQSEFADYQKQQANMPEAKKQEVQQRLVKKQQDIEEYRRSKFAQGTGEIYRRQEELLKPVKEKTFKMIEVVAKEEGMQFVFDKAGDILLLYADPLYDITYKVLDKLKRGK